MQAENVWIRADKYAAFTGLKCGFACMLAASSFLVLGKEVAVDVYLHLSTGFCPGVILPQQVSQKAQARGKRQP